MRCLMLTFDMAGRVSFLRAHSLARHLTRLGHQTTLLAAASAPRLAATRYDAEGVRVIEAPDILPERIRQGGLSPLDVASRLRFILRHGFDLVHGFGHRPTVSIPALACRRWHRAAFVSDWADLWGRGGIADERRGLARVVLGGFDHLLEGWMHARADALTVVSGELLRRGLALGVSADRIRFVPPGANVDVIRPLSKRSARQKYGLPLDARIAVHIGFAPYDARLLGQTLATLAGRDPRARLLMTGRRMLEFERVVQAAGVEERVIHMGVVPYDVLGEVLACGDVMVLPYSGRDVNLGRYPNRIGEYMAAARPTVTNPTGELGRMVLEEKIGVVADESPDALADAIAKLFDDPVLCDELGQRARQVAETKFAWEVLAREVNALYSEVCSAPRQSGPVHQGDVNGLDSLRRRSCMMGRRSEGPDGPR